MIVFQQGKMGLFLPQEESGISLGKPPKRQDNSYHYPLIKSSLFPFIEVAQFRKLWRRERLLSYPHLQRKKEWLTKKRKQSTFLLSTSFSFFFPNFYCYWGNGTIKNVCNYSWYTEATLKVALGTISFHGFWA